jgi:hypothetical protein
MSFEGEVLQRLASIETSMKYYADEKKLANGRTAKLESAVAEINIRYARRADDCVQKEVIEEIKEAAISRKAVRGFVLGGIAIIATLSSVISTLISFVI